VSSRVCTRCWRHKGETQGIKANAKVSLMTPFLAPHRGDRLFIIVGDPDFVSVEANSNGYKPTCTVPRRAPSRGGACLWYCLKEGRPRVGPIEKNALRVRADRKDASTAPSLPAVSYGVVVEGVAKPRCRTVPGDTRWDDFRPPNSAEQRAGRCARSFVTV